MPKQKEKVLTDDFERQMARNQRNAHWGYMQQIAHSGVMYVRWNKYSKPDGPQHLSFCLMSIMDFQSWTKQHPEWWDVGEWDDEQYGNPYRVTDAGRKALTEKHLYDMEPHHGGMVEPGYVVIPAEVSPSA